MDLKIKLEQLHQKVIGLKDQIGTEEATKNAFVMPFIQILGYDIFNPTEVVPEHVCDIGTKKGEKVDYVIKNNDEPIFIIECKHWKESADAHNSQLHRYYHVSKTRFGVLTNGIVYNFYTDLEKPNIMDEKPFFTINIEDLKDSSIKILESFTKKDYNLESILDSAEALKYIKAIRKEFEKEIENPSDELVKLLVNRFFEKPLTANRMVSFKEYAKKALATSINESISFRLKSALSIKQIPSSRIAYRDTLSYFGILLDDNNRKPLCRLHFNTANKYLEIFHNGKDAGEKVLLNSLDEIYNYRNQLHQTLENYN